MATLQARLTDLITAIGADIKTIGSLASLTTTNKTSVVAAINEVKATPVPISQLTAGATITVSKTAGTWPARPTARTDIIVQWKGADPSPAIVASGTGGMMDGVDLRLVTP